MVPQPRPGAVKVVAAPESCAGFVAGPGVAVSVRGATVSVGRRVAVAMGGVAVAVVAALVPPVVAAAAPVVVPPVVVAPALLAAAAPGLVPALAAVRLLAAPPVPAVPAAGLVLWLELEREKPWSRPPLPPPPRLKSSRPLFLS